MTAAIDVTPGQHKIILDLLRRHLPDTTAWVYGSRVKGATRTCSDLDMVVFSAPEQQIQVSNLREAFDESSLPFKVDLFVWDDLPENFKKNIETECAILAEKKTQVFPKEWKKRKIGEVTYINTDTYSQKEDWEFVNYLDTGNITEDIISDVQKIPKGKRLPSRARRKIQSGDIVYSTVRPNQKHYGIIADPLENMLVSTGFSVIRGDEKQCNTKFLYYFLTQDSMVNFLHAIGEQSTSAYPSIKPSDIEMLDITLPGLQEQRAIAHILGSLDEKIEHNRRMNETLEAMAQALFKSWFVNFDPVIDNALAAGNRIPEPLQARAALRKNQGSARKPLPDNIRRLFPSKFRHTQEMGWIPAGWEEETLGDVVDIAKGRNITKTSTKNGLVPVVAGGLSPAYYHDTANVNGPVVTISASGANAGYVNLYYEDIWASDCSYINNTLFEHLYYIYLTFKSKQKEIYGLQKGSAQPHVYPRDLKKLSVVVPQNTIVKIFEELVAHNFHNIAALIKKSRLLEKLRDILLTKLLSGEIRIPDAENTLGEVS